MPGAEQSEEENMRQKKQPLSAYRSIGDQNQLIDVCKGFDRVQICGQDPEWCGKLAEQMSGQLPGTRFIVSVVPRVDPGVRAVLLVSDGMKPHYLERLLNRCYESDCLILGVLQTGALAVPNSRRVPVRSGI